MSAEQAKPIFTHPGTCYKCPLGRAGRETIEKDGTPGQEFRIDCAVSGGYGRVRVKGLKFITDGIAPPDCPQLPQVEC